MKLQYLGDSKDAFKWDYLDFLARSLNFSTLTVVPMLTPEDDGEQGGTQPTDFPCSDAVLRFCNVLRDRRSLGELLALPNYTGASYSVALHKEADQFTNRGRRNYFKGLPASPRNLVFVDPDNGFEPENITKQHICYSDMAELLKQCTNDSVVSVFQHFRRTPFRDDFAQIREQLDGVPTTAVYWDGRLMFVTVGKSADVISSVAGANRRYAESRPVRVIA